MRVRLDISYVGTRYAGWQKQPGRSTVQRILEDALGVIYAQPVIVTGAGRTDAGVHAAGQVAHFDASKDRPPARDLARILNKILPPDVAILRAAGVPGAFHARKSAVRRTYLYRILTRDNPDTFRAPYVWHAPWVRNLSIDKMRRAAHGWLGEKDFSMFAIRVSSVESTQRRMEKIEIRRVRDEIRMTFVADSFLHRMIRRMVAVLVDAGAGKSVSQPAYAAPAGGLCLQKVAYR